MGNEARLTDMVFILDKSGSMSGLEKDTIGGFNSMIRKQRTLAGDALVTTVLFDTSIKRLYDGVSIGKVTDMTEEDYEAGGSTALLDAIGSTISAISRRQKQTILSSSSSPMERRIQAGSIPISRYVR